MVDYNILGRHIRIARYQKNCAFGRSADVPGINCWSVVGLSYCTFRSCSG